MKATGFRKDYMNNAIENLKEDFLFRGISFSEITYWLEKLNREEVLFVVWPAWKGMVRDIREQIAGERKHETHSQDNRQKEEWVNDRNQQVKSWIKNYNWSKEVGMPRISTKRISWFVDQPVVLTSTEWVIPWEFAMGFEDDWPEVDEWEIIRGKHDWEIMPVIGEEVGYEHWMLTSKPKVIGGHAPDPIYSRPKRKPYNRTRTKAERIKNHEEICCEARKPKRELRAKGGKLEKCAGMPKAMFAEMARLARNGKPMDRVAKAIASQNQTRETHSAPVDMPVKGVKIEPSDVPTSWGRSCTSRQSVIRSSRIRKAADYIDMIASVA